MQPHKYRYKIGEQGALLSIASTTLLAAFEFTAGVIGHSNAVIADSIHTISDLFASIVVFVGFKISQIPADAHHPYGHARAESIAAKIVSLLLIGLGIKVLSDSVRTIIVKRFYEPELIALVATIVAIVAQYALFLYVYKLGNRIRSTSLIADASHHKSDALSSVAALIGVAGARLGLKFMDPLAGIFVAGLVIKTGAEVFHTAFDELLDAAPSKELEDTIKKSVISTEGVKAVKKLHVRKLGVDLYIDLIIDVDKDKSVEQGHLITIKVKKNIITNIPAVKEILIHVEPYAENLEY